MKSASERESKSPDAALLTHVNTRFLPFQALKQNLIEVFQAPQGDSQTSFLRQLIQNSGIYALASFVLPLISLVLSPFLTHTLSRADYGALALLTTAITLATGLTQFGLNSAFFRAYNYDYTEAEDKRAVLATLCSILLLSSLTIALLLLLIAPWISLFLFASEEYITPIRLAILAVLLQNMSVPGLAWLRAENRAWPYATLSICNLLINLVATILCVGLWQMGVSGAVLATAAGYALIVLWTLPQALFRAGVR
ncbi:MAG TPA: oligosaccharide flippase family protein, partial [Ktedonobacteraceae bacterium]|nr:oligosaccharide flippase family protein [Ktedonobacteraceae bacterium]